ncbi:MAG: histidinol-phosphatase HisJ family protein [Ruminococcaceae bacterium]|nr:histidinol-phosphatase HisJ family protein [Oscillospiraceae bacterium]
MFLTDYHVHSDVSQDSKATMYEMAEAEAKMGIEQMCFTNHCDMVNWRTYEPNPGCMTKPAESLEKYAALLREHPKLPLDVRIGLELGEPLFNIEIAKRLASTPGLDMVMGSLHILQEYGDLWCVKFTSPEHCRKIFDVYVDELIKMAELNFFDVMAHIGYGRRYMWQQGYDEKLSMELYGDKIELLLRLLIDNGRGIEINCSGIRDGCGPFPDPEVLRLYKALGGEIITVGSDAHRPSDAAKCVREGYEIIKSCGFEYVSTFKNRKCEFVKI